MSHTNNKNTAVSKSSLKTWQRRTTIFEDFGRCGKAGAPVHGASTSSVDDFSEYDARWYIFHDYMHVTGVMALLSLLLLSCLLTSFVMALCDFDLAVLYYVPKFLLGILLFFGATCCAGSVLRKSTSLITLFGLITVISFSFALFAATFTIVTGIATSGNDEESEDKGGFLNKSPFVGYARDSYGSLMDRVLYGTIAVVNIFACILSRRYFVYVTEKNEVTLKTCDQASKSRSTSKTKRSIAK